MSATTNDRLLAILRVIIWVLFGLIGFAAVVLLGLALILPFMGPEALIEMSIGTDPTVRWVVNGMLLIAVGVLVMALRFLQHLLALIDTVGQGDPFVPANADRLEQMGWITVFAAGISFVLIAMAIFVKGREPQAEITVDLDPGILILALVLFVLARVFRHGTEMRRDLEGTV